MIVIGGSSGSQYGAMGWEDCHYGEDIQAKYSAMFLGTKIAHLAKLIK